MQAPNPDPHDSNLLIQLMTYAWVLLVSMFGGLVSFIREHNATKSKVPLKDKLGQISSALTVSAFSGLITYWLCQYWELHPALSAVFIAISGHAGGKSIDAIGRIWMSILDEKGK